MNVLLYEVCHKMRRNSCVYWQMTGPWEW